MEKVKTIVDEIVQNKKVIDIKSCQILERDTPQTYVEVHYSFNDEEHDNPNEIWAYGDGFVDALLEGLVGRFEDDYKSLKNLKLCRFEVSAKIKKDLATNQSDAKVVVEIGVKTPTSKEILFIEEDVSLVRACTKAVREAVQFMINCEEAVKVVYACLQQAKMDGRIDSVEHYTNALIELVKITSYEEILIN